MDAPLKPSTRLMIAPGQVSANLSGEEVILSMQDGVYYGLDPIGARIWALLQQARSLDELADIVVAEYEVDRASALRDLVSLAGQMIERGLVEVVDGAAP